MADGLLGDARGDQLARATFMSLAAMSQ